MSSLKANCLEWGFGARRLGGPFTHEFRLASITSVVGPNGVGKSCLVRTLAGLIPALSGSVHVGKEDVHLLRPTQRAALLSYLPQTDSNDLGFTVTEAVAVGRFRFNRTLVEDPEERRIVSQAIEFVGLKDYAGTPVAMLSGGEAQRVKLARALVQDTPIVMMDEPGSHLDLGQLHKLGHVLRRLATEGRTVLVVSHDIAWCQEFSDGAFLLAHTGAHRTGTPQEVLHAESVAHAFGLTRESH